MRRWLIHWFVYLPLLAPAPSFAAAPWAGPGFEAMLFPVALSAVLLTGMWFNPPTRNAVKLPLILAVVLVFLPAVSLALINATSGSANVGETIAALGLVSFVSLFIGPWVVLIGTVVALISSMLKAKPPGGGP